MSMAVLSTDFDKADQNCCCFVDVAARRLYNAFLPMMAIRTRFTKHTRRPVAPRQPQQHPKRMVVLGAQGSIVLLRKVTVFKAFCLLLNCTRVACG